MKNIEELNIEYNDYTDLLNSTIDRLAKMQCSTVIDSNLFCYNTGSNLPEVLARCGTSRFSTKNLENERLKLKEYSTTLVKYVEELRTDIHFIKVYNIFSSIEYFLKGIFEQFTGNTLDLEQIKHGDTHIKFSDFDINDILNQQISISSIAIRNDCIEKVLNVLVKDTNILGEYNEEAI